MQRVPGESFAWEEVFNSLDDLIFVVDSEFSIVRSNRKASEFFGIYDDTTPSKCYEILFNTNQPCAQCHKHQGGSNIASCTRNNQLKIKGFNFRIKTNPIQGSSSNSIKHVIFLHDITEELKAQEGLSATEKKYRLLAENSSDVILMTDANSLKFTYASPSVTNLTGYSPEEFIGLSLDEVMPPDSYKRVRALYATDKTRGKVTDIYQITKKDNTLSWVEMAITPLRNDNGDITGYISQSRNINEKKAALDALKVSEERYRLVQDNTDIRISYFTADGKAVFINRASARNLGTTPEELEGKHYREILTPQILPGFEKNFKEILNSPTPVYYEDTHESDTIKINLLITLSRLEDTQSKLKGVLVIIKDITELKKAQNETKDYANRLLSLLEISQMDKLSPNEILDHSLEQAIAFTKSKFGFLFLYNEKKKKFKLHNWSQSVIKGCKTQETKANCLSEDNELWPRAIRTRKPVIINNFDEEISGKKILPKGHVGISKYLSVPIFWNDEIVAMLSVANKAEGYKENDIHQVQLLMNTVWKIIERNKTERKLIAAKEKAEESDRLKSSFLSNMSHEIRTPINGIMGFLSLIREEEFDIEKKERFFKLIDNNFNHLITIISDIIDISKLESNQVRLLNSDVNIPNLIDEVIEVTQSENKLLPDKNISIYIETPVSSTICETIHADRVRLRQVLINLINNALKFTNEGEVKIGYKPTPCKEFVEFYVHDTGIGIRKKQQKHIFDRFRQADETLTKKYGGTGLGLSICKHLVELMGGKISVESKFNKYSTFRFTLPFTPSLEVTDFNDTTELQSISADWNNKTILIVEDDDSNFLFLREYLKQTKAKFLRTSSCEETYKFLDEHHSIDLVLLDIRLPDGNGTDLIPKIREHLPQVPIIAQTAFALEDEKQKYIQKGCDDYISKPINVEKLKKIINQQLSRAGNTTTDSEKGSMQEQQPDDITIHE